MCVGYVAGIYTYANGQPDKGRTISMVTINLGQHTIGYTESLI